MTMPPAPDKIDPETLRRAEEVFLSLAQTHQFAFYFGRYPDLYPDELRALFGLVIASIRQASRADEVAAAGAASSLPRMDNLAHAERQALEDRLEAMTAALAQRDERIRELTSKLRKKESKSG